MVKLTSKDITNGVLTRKRFDAVVFPGGTIWSLWEELQEEGRKAVMTYVYQGGGFLGTCCGAWFVSLPYSAMLGVTTVDSKHWDRGQGSFTGHCHQNAAQLIVRNCPGLVKCNVTDQGRAVFGPEFLAPISMFFRGGPLFSVATGKNKAFKCKIPKATVLAVFEDELVKPGGAGSACGCLSLFHQLFREASWTDARCSSSGSRRIWQG